MAKILMGKVVSVSMDKTAVVAITRLKKHPIYGKKYKVTKKYFAHDAENKAKVGDLAHITAMAPLSKRKRWMLVKLITGREKS